MYSFKPNVRKKDPKRYMLSIYKFQQYTYYIYILRNQYMNHYVWNTSVLLYHLETKLYNKENYRVLIPIIYKLASYWIYLNATNTYKLYTWEILYLNNIWHKRMNIHFYLQENKASKHFSRATGMSKQTINP